MLHRIEGWRATHLGLFRHVSALELTRVGAFLRQCPQCTERVVWLRSCRVSRSASAARMVPSRSMMNCAGIGSVQEASSLNVSRSSGKVRYTSRRYCGKNGQPPDDTPASPTEGTSGNRRGATAAPHWTPRVSRSRVLAAQTTISRAGGGITDRVRQDRSLTTTGCRGTLRVMVRRSAPSCARRPA